MSLDRGSVLAWIHRFAASDFLPQATAILILLAGGMLVYRSFRERYFLLWIQGWAAYLIYKFASANAMFSSPERFPWAMVADMAFVLALTFFAASVLFYANNRKLLLPLAGSAIVALEAAVVRVLWLPGSHAVDDLLFGMEVAITATASLQLVIHCRGRRSAGPVLFAGSLILLPLVPRIAGLSTLVELLLGLGMVIFVLEETQLRANRLRVVHDITTSIAEAHDFGAIMASVLEELKALVYARSAWFRLLEGEELVLYQYIGLPPEYLKDRHAIPLEGSLAQEAIQKAEPMVVRVARLRKEMASLLRPLKLNHLILVPVFGKNSVVGSVVLGCKRSRRYTESELEFLRTTSRQLGIAVENLRMFEQVMRTQRQWASTFDSIEDIVLVHDEAFQIIKANRALVNRLGLKTESVVGQPCDAVLPGAKKEGTGCPYCSREVGMYRDVPDPCFGGFSMVSTSSYAEEASGRRGTIHIIRDITHQRTAEEKYRLLFQQAQEGVYISTPEGRLVDCNEAFARMLGYSSREEILKLDVGHDLYASPDQREAFCREMAADNFVRNYEVSLRRKDGSRITVLETSFASRDAAGSVDCYQGFMLDISEKKRAEEEIRRRNRELFALNTIAVMATQSLDLDEILDVTLRQVMDLFSADTGGVLLVDEDTRTLRRRVNSGHHSDFGTKLTEFPIPEEFWATITRSRTQIITHQHWQHLPPVVAQFVEAEDLKAWLWATLWSKDRIVGLMGVSSRSPREFTATDENLMIAIGRQLATTIEKIRLYEETTRAYEDLRHTQEQLLQSEKMSAVG
ncbi:MAG: GAF domain-containing protein, partial [Terriglobales bacterium]